MIGDAKKRLDQYIYALTHSGDPREATYGYVLNDILDVITENGGILGPPGPKGDKGDKGDKTDGTIAPQSSADVPTETTIV